MKFRDRVAALVASSDTPVPHPETRQPSGTQSYVQRGGVDRDDPPKDDYQKYRMQYRVFPLVRAALDRRAGETVRPGYRIEADDETTAEELEKWFESAGIYAGETGQPFYPILWQIARDYDLDGEVPIEHVYDDPTEEDPDKRKIVGVKVFDPATVQFLNYPGTSMLIRPDDDDPPEGTPQTKRDENACLVQYPGDSDAFGLQQGEVYKSQNDITRIPRHPGFDTGAVEAAGISKEENVGNVRGVSLVEAVSEEVERLRARLQDYNASIANMAYPRLKIEFEDYVVGKGTDEPVIVEWADRDIRGYMGLLERDDAETGYSPEDEWKDPGGMFGSPPGIETELIHGNVPEIGDSITTSVNLILGGLGVPKYMIGFGDDLNRRISQEQGVSFDQDIASTRRNIGRKVTPLAQIIAEQLARDDESPVENTDGVRFRITTEGAEDPLSDEDFDAEKFQRLMTGLKAYFDAGMEAYFPLDEFVRKILNMDPDELGIAELAEEMQSADANDLDDIAQRTNGDGTDGDGSDENAAEAIMAAGEHGARSHTGENSGPEPGGENNNGTRATLGGYDWRTGTGTPDYGRRADPSGDAQQTTRERPAEHGREDPADSTDTSGPSRPQAGANGSADTTATKPNELAETSQQAATRETRSTDELLIEAGVAPEDIPGFGLEAPAMPTHPVETNGNGNGGHEANGDGGSALDERSPHADDE